MNSETENENTEAWLKDTKEERAQVTEATWVSSCRGRRMSPLLMEALKSRTCGLLKGCRLVDGIPGQQGFLYLHGGRFLAGNPLRTSKPSGR